MSLEFFHKSLVGYIVSALFKKNRSKRLAEDPIYFEWPIISDVDKVEFGARDAKPITRNSRTDRNAKILSTAHVGGEKMTDARIKDKSREVILVRWYTEHDSQNPLNWSISRKAFVLLCIGLYSFVVYMGASIYSPGMESFMDEFGVGHAYASLGLALYM